MLYINGLDIQIKNDVVTLLEEKLAAHVGYAHVVVVESEENAFRICLAQCTQDDEVLCSPLAPLSLHRTLNRISMHPIYTDIKLDGTVESRFLERQLSQKSKCFVLSHYQGIKTPSKEIRNFCQEKYLFMIEDATQIFYKKEKSGANVTVFSLDQLMDSSFAQGSFIATDDAALATQLRLNAQGGYQKRKNWNYDLMNIEKNVQLPALMAHLVLMSLEESPSYNKNAQKIYREMLSNVKLITLPEQKGLSNTTYFPVMLSPGLFCPKEDIYQELLEAGVDVEVGLKPVYKTAAFLDDSIELFGVEEVYRAILLLPIHRDMNEDDVVHVVTVFKTILEKYAYRGCSF